VNIDPTRARKPSGEGVSQRVQGPRQATEKGYGSSAAVPSGSLDLSAGAREFVRIRSRLETVPGAARAERVAELRSLVARRAYHVDGERIADAMLQDDGAALALGLL
jgi:anti-sigma28 factor (negative regulator of flagellin synthesis)